ncbi:M56 family metallopeptidase [Labedella endophytica]|uniref:M56 family peptidase n=1 Tax=Labedella endophytica TaxID=1523160 RepID=A0A433JN29_9MICO|nr:M56 family metallopeptidase [Labedella endophytica]RUQ97167.1 M56 family peptidase [Labedella endophytica]
MIASTIALAVLAWALAWPIPARLSRAHWTSRAPRTALVLWQSIALTGGLSMIGSLLIFGLSAYGDSPLSAGDALVRETLAGGIPDGATIFQVGSLSFAVLLTGHLLLNLTATFVRTERQRRRHLDLVTLLSDPVPGEPRTRRLDHPAPVAYCLPGAFRSVTVLSDGLLDLLDEDELRAVLEHERAHLQHQHALVLLSFRSWGNALPWFPIAHLAETAVESLVEYIADDQARTVVDSHQLASAIALIGSAGAPSGAVHADSPARDYRVDTGVATTRIRRLLDGPPPLEPRVRIAILTGAILLLLLPLTLLLTISLVA